LKLNPFIVGTDPDGRELFVVQGERERYDANRQRLFDQYLRDCDRFYSLQKMAIGPKYLAEFPGGKEPPPWVPPAFEGSRNTATPASML